MQRTLEIVTDTWQSGDWVSAAQRVEPLVVSLIGIYVVSLILNFTYTRAMAVITQGSLEKFREKLFDHMQDLPISFFDQHQRGDIMSHYTNDIDALRQMIGPVASQHYAYSRDLHFCCMRYGVLQRLACFGSCLWRVVHGVHDQSARFSFCP